MNKKYVVKLVEKYEDLSSSIEGAWKEIIGWGCGYFDHWVLLDDSTIRVFYNKSSRCRGGIDQDDISIDDILKVINNLGK